MTDHPRVLQKGRTYWLCECSCGIQRPVRPDRLRAGLSQSCGCIRSETVLIGARGPVHGQSGTPEYKIWAQLKQRCFNPNHKLWRLYGARGVSMAGVWRDSFVAFYDEVGDRPGDEYRLVRIDVERDYEPGNVKWSVEGEPSLAPERPAEGGWWWRGRWRPI